MDSDKKIPEKYRQLTITQAFTIIGIPKATFYRNYLDKGKISVSMDENGKKHIAFDELFRVFGERSLTGLHKFIDGPSETSQKESHGPNGTAFETLGKNSSVSILLNEYLDLKTRLAEAEKAAELQKARADELKVQLDREQSRFSETLQTVQGQMRLLESRDYHKTWYQRLRAVFVPSEANAL